MEEAVGQLSKESYKRTLLTTLTYCLEVESSLMKNAGKGVKSANKVTQLSTKDLTPFPLYPVAERNWRDRHGGQVY